MEGPGSDPLLGTTRPADAFLQQRTGALNNIQRVTDALWGGHGGLPPSWALLPQRQPGGGCVVGLSSLNQP